MNKKYHIQEGSIMEQIDAGTIMTIPKEILTDNIRKELFPGDKVCVSID